MPTDPPAPAPAPAPVEEAGCPVCGLSLNWHTNGGQAPGDVFVDGYGVIACDAVPGPLRHPRRFTARPEQPAPAPVPDRGEQITSIEALNALPVWSSIVDDGKGIYLKIDDNDFRMGTYLASPSFRSEDFQVEAERGGLRVVTSRPEVVEWWKKQKEAMRPAPAPTPIRPFEIILLTSDGEFARNLLYDVQEDLNTGEHGNVTDSTTRTDWNGKPRRFEILVNEVTGALNLTLNTNNLEEAVKLRQIAVDKFNERFDQKLKRSREAREAEAAATAAPKHCEKTEPCVDDVYCNCPCADCERMPCYRPGCACSRSHPPAPVEK